ncbi:MAG: serine hydrolase [Patescibacteria group bacterium]
MNIRWQSLILILIILISVALTKTDFGKANIFPVERDEEKKSSVDTNSSLTNEGGVRPGTAKNDYKLPMRMWSVLDSEIKAQAVLIQSLDSGFPFLHYNTYKQWPIASISKLMTAIVVLENIGENKKIPISKNATLIEGIAGDLKSGEVYSSRDLIKIMLLTSSNDAAVAFGEYMDGSDELVRALNKKARELGMNDTIFYDESGLSDLNVSTAHDLLILTKYIIEKHPEIFSWTRTNSFLVEPMNDPKTRTVTNIIPFLDNRNFLGGKTGTIESSHENFLGIFLLKNYRVAVIVLGSPNRVEEVPALLKWVEEAYTFPE